MKQLQILLLLVLTLSFSLYGQITNVNPDPNGEPWLVGGLRPLTKTDFQFLNSLPELNQLLKNKNFSRAILPSRVDNSFNQYFPPVFNQADGSCAQSSGIAYTFTYEMSVKRNTTPNNTNTQYPSHYTYNFLNDGSGSNGSWYWDGWEIGKANGIPTAATYGGRLNPLGDNGWMSGYAKYEAGMANRVQNIFTINVSTPDGLQELKAWFNDHASGQTVGGIVNFAAGATGYDMRYLPSGTHEAGKTVIVRWGTEVNHAMTFVGYDDSVRFDYNNDGRYTNDEDTNGDGSIDMRDWEKGALIMVNTWGTWFGDNGRSYVMYRLLAESVENGGIWAGKVHGITVKENYEPLLTARVVIQHDSRNKIKISVGASSDPNASQPDMVLNFPLFNFQGGAYYLQGGTSDEANKTLELGLDISPVVSALNSGQAGRIFLIVDEDDPQNSGTGVIKEFAVKNFRNGGTETVCDQQDIPLNENNRTMLSIPTTVSYNGPEITTNSLPQITPEVLYSQELTATGGTPPYYWNLVMDYSEESANASFPSISDQQLTPGGNDDDVATYDLPFAFSFFGKTYSQVQVSTDGSLLFNSGFEYVRSEPALKDVCGIAVFGADLMLYPNQGDGMWVQSSETSVTFRWKTSMYDAPGVNVEAAATLNVDGSIQLYYGEGISQGISWVAGVSDGEGNMKTISISGTSQVPANFSCLLNPPSFPNGFQMSEEGMLTGITSEHDQSWNIKVRVTDNIGLFAESVIPLTVGPLDIFDSHTLSTFSLEPNYPNPFNPSTTIRYNLNHAGPISVRIFNSMGQLVKTLVDEFQKPGMHSVQWNGTDNHQHLVPSGVYFCRVSAGAHSSSIKMVLMK